MTIQSVYTILVAEDNEVNQKLVSSILTKSGINYRIVSNGQEAIKVYENESFDLILMDCQMPIMDGFAATEKIREIEKSKSRKRVPIIAITANAMKGDREKCIGKGMDDFLSKPFRMNELLDIIGVWTKSNRKELYEAG